jgi:hypothetical protein
MGEAMRMINIIALVVNTQASHITFERMMLASVEQIFEQWAHVLQVRQCLQDFTKEEL